jgi:hypothetical protein
MTTINGINHHGKESPYPFTEDSLQTACATYLRAQYPKALWLHCPNGGSRNRIEAAKLKMMGVLPGASDLMIFEPRNFKGLRPCGLFIELKTKGGKLQETQASFIIEVQARGYMAAVCWNFDAFKALVDEYFYNT